MESRLAKAIYNASPVWLQDLLISAYGYKLYRLRYGGVFHQQLARLERIQAYSVAELAALQNEELQRLLTHAQRNVPWYRRRFAELGIQPQEIDLNSLQQLPILDKRELKAHSELFVAENLPARSLQTLNTSGTTGSPLVIKASRAALQTNYAFFERFLRQIGVGSRDRSITFAGRLLLPPRQKGAPYWRRNLTMNTLLCSSYHIAPDTASAYLRRIARYQPLYIDAYPSAIYQLAQHVLTSGEDWGIRPKAIVTSSETLLEHQREAIEQAFQCRVYDQYGSAEMAACITQCERGSYHVNPDYGIVEIVKSDGTPARPGEAGDLICTGFVNEAMPMIRYRIGDMAVADDRTCSCGLAWPVIGSILGRLDDVIVTADGRRIGRLDPLFKGLRGIEEAQIVQVALDRIRVNLVPGNDYSSRVGEALTAALKRRVGADMQVELVLLDRIPRTAAGKFRAVVSQLEPQTAQPRNDAAVESQ
ncbi:MAG: phenylacetate--CoA ligase family protein [Xanthomonadaceae bacterium]|mgnify:FL=1|nr:phenylacetate--CoA ligase family protein [Xanthomonadaceae bacterium]